MPNPNSSKGKINLCALGRKRVGPEMLRQLRDIECIRARLQIKRNQPDQRDKAPMLR